MWIIIVRVVWKWLSPPCEGLGVCYCGLGFFFRAGFCLFLTEVTSMTLLQFPAWHWKQLNQYCWGMMAGASCKHRVGRIGNSDQAGTVQMQGLPFQNKCHMMMFWGTFMLVTWPCNFWQRAVIVIGLTKSGENQPNTTDLFARYFRILTEHSCFTQLVENYDSNRKKSLRKWQVKNLASI